MTSPIIQHQVKLKLPPHQIHHHEQYKGDVTRPSKQL